MVWLYARWFIQYDPVWCLLALSSVQSKANIVSSFCQVIAAVQRNTSETRGHRTKPHLSSSVFISCSRQFSGHDFCLWVWWWCMEQNGLQNRRPWPCWCRVIQHFSTKEDIACRDIREYFMNFDAPSDPWQPLFSLLLSLLSSLFVSLVFFFLFLRACCPSSFRLLVKVFFSQGQSYFFPLSFRHSSARCHVVRPVWSCEFVGRLGSYCHIPDQTSYCNFKPLHGTH